jgi:hypothetical protein
MFVTEKKLIANRRNALKSTGPKTAYGKFRSSRNGLKHGHYASFNLAAAIINIPAKDRTRLLNFLIRHFRSAVTGRTSRLPKHLVGKKRRPD